MLSPNDAAFPTTLFTIRYSMSFAHQACGSGGTAAGMALGIRLSGFGCRLHAMGVCDDPRYFYDYIDGLLQGMGATQKATGVSHIW